MSTYTQHESMRLVEKQDHRFAREKKTQRAIKQMSGWRFQERVWATIAVEVMRPSYLRTCARLAPIKRAKRARLKLDRAKHLTFDMEKKQSRRLQWVPRFISLFCFNHTLTSNSSQAFDWVTEGQDWLFYSLQCMESSSVQASPRAIVRVLVRGSNYGTNSSRTVTTSCNPKNSLELQ